MATTNIIILFWPLKYSATRNGLLAPYIPPRDKVDHNVIGKNTLYYYCFAFTQPFFLTMLLQLQCTIFLFSHHNRKKSLDKSLSRTFIKYFVAVISVANYCYLFSLQIYVAKTFFEKNAKVGNTDGSCKILGQQILQLVWNLIPILSLKCNITSWPFLC